MRRGEHRCEHNRENVAIVANEANEQKPQNHAQIAKSRGSRALAKAPCDDCKTSIPGSIPGGASNIGTRRPFAAACSVPAL
jgi:hypothetical protein